MHPEGALSVVADEFASGGCDSAAFSAAFAEATVYALRPPSPARPGLLAA